MQIKSKFRKLFWFRIAIGFVIFLVAFYYSFNCIFNNSQNIKNPFVLAAVLVMSFLIYISIDLFAIFKLVVLESGIEKTILISGKKQFFPFKQIINIKREKIRLRSKTGNISDGYHFSVIKFENNKVLIISPDYFENYEEIITSIKSNM